MTDTIHIFCSGEFRALPSVIWTGLTGPKPSEPSEFICNGCTMSPDYILWKRAWPACVIHDYQYNHTSLPRKECDRIFRENLKFSLKADGLPFFLAAPAAFLYYRAVRRLGRGCYNGTGDPS